MVGLASSHVKVKALILCKHYYKVYIRTFQEHLNAHTLHTCVDYKGIQNSSPAYPGGPIGLQIDTGRVPVLALPIHDCPEPLLLLPAAAPSLPPLIHTRRNSEHRSEAGEDCASDGPESGGCD